MDFPAARTVIVPDRGEFFLRDSGGTGTPLFMLHGWTGTADLNFGSIYDDLIGAGYRVVAMDHRGHGRGPRPFGRFLLDDCAADAAAVMSVLNLPPAIVYGYSMGGAIAQLICRDHPALVSGLVLSGTAQHWQEPELRNTWRLMPLVGLAMSLAPATAWRVALRRAGFKPTPQTAWLYSEMMRHSARAITQAGSELGRFDSRPWLQRFPFPTAMVLTSRDDAVPPAKQFELAQACGATVFDAPLRHLDVAATADRRLVEVYSRALLEALDWVQSATESASVLGHGS
ncbi:MAG: alpha/beta fold hydrolase [Solirubrobacteraceae bacterium]